MAVESMSYASPPVVRTSRGGQWRALALVGLGVGIGTAGRVSPASWPSTTAPASSEALVSQALVSTEAAQVHTPKVAFLARANGVVTRQVELASLPGGGRVLVVVDPGATVEVGGEIHVRAGLTRRTLYWVRLTEPPRSYGFAPADAIAVSADVPIAPLDIAGLGEADWLAPATGVQQALGGPAAGDPALKDTACCDPSALAAAQTAVQAVSWLPATVRRYEAPLAEAGARHSVDPALLAIVTLVESGGNPAAVSGSGARGLMQIMPPTAASIGQACTDAPFDAATSIDCGARYLATQLKAFGLAEDPGWLVSVDRAAAAYNAGPDAASKWLAGASLPSEAEHYRRWVTGMWRERAEADSATYRAWLAAGGSRLVQAAEATEG